MWCCGGFFFLGGVTMGQEKRMIAYWYALLLLNADAFEFSTRDAVIRPGYGVVFTRLGEIVDVGAGGTHLHTWYFSDLDPQLPLIDELACSFSGDDGTGYIADYCDALNDIIRGTNTRNVELIRKARNAYLAALRTLPDADALENISFPRFEEEVRPTNAFRQREERAVVAVVLAVTTVSTLAYGFFKTLFSGPTQEEFAQLVGAKDKLRDLMDLQTREVVQLKKEVVSFARLTDERIDNHFELVRAVVRNLGNLESITNRLMANFHSRQRNLNRTAELFGRMNADLYGRIYPALLAVDTSAHAIAEEYNRRREGLLILLRGYLPQSFVPLEAMEDVLRGISDPIVPNAAEYYSMKNTFASRQGSQDLLISMRIPLRVKHQAGLILYKVQTMAVELTAGTKEANPGSTRISDIPDFFAISPDELRHTALSYSEFLGCDKGTSGGRYLCGIHFVNHGETCASAVFKDNGQGVRDLCRVTYDPSPTRSAAYQLDRNDTFLMFAAPDETQWRITCPDVRRGPSAFSQTPCSLCRIPIPCRCTLTGSNFVLPKRLSGCLKRSKVELVRGTTIFHRNTIAFSEELDETSLGGVASTEERYDQLFPALEIEPPRLDDKAKNITGRFLERKIAHSIDYRKMMAALNAGTPLIRDKVDEALAEAMDFSDLKFYDKVTFLESVKSLSMSLLKEFNFLGLFSLSLSPYLLSYAAFSLSALYSGTVFIRAFRTNIFANFMK